MLGSTSVNYFFLERLIFFSEKDQFHVAVESEFVLDVYYMRTVLTWNIISFCGQKDNSFNSCTSCMRYCDV